MKKVLVIQTASIGDVILATPVLEALHSTFPECKIDLLIKKGNESLFVDHPFLHRLWIWNKAENKYKTLLSLIKEIRQEKYDLIVNLQRFFSTGLITALSGAKLTVGFKKNPLAIFFSKRYSHHLDGRHETKRNLSLLKGIANISDARMTLYPPKSAFALVSQYKTKQYICIAPASLWFTKQYPEDKWIDLVKQLDPDLMVYFLGGSSDRSLCDRIINQSQHALTLNLAGKLSLLETAALMRDAQRNLVNDSAPMHLAGSVNGPISVIFCSTVERFGFGPLSNDSIVIQTERKLKCRPCGLHGHKKCPKGDFECAYSIETTRIINTL
ncbi:MAG: glycosyltransferase family 9 protein [Sphingobacteriia bacterium]|nr:glycosyltransferase family 9 protein [Sphingobacteriia bacterium]